MFPDLAQIVNDLDNLPMYEPPSEELAAGVLMDIAHSVAFGGEGERECALVLRSALEVIKLLHLQNEYLRSQLYSMVHWVDATRIAAAIESPLRGEKARN